MLTRTTFLGELQQLTRDATGTDGAVASIDCIRSAHLRECARCMFSRELTRCYRCTYCADCADCSQLTHSQRCQSCHASAYLADCRHCSGSAYLLQCLGCTDCTYCLGCVGLHKKDFHILNRPYARKDYFAALARLTRELGRA